jgi:hypothetical protein
MPVLKMTTPFSGLNIIADEYVQIHQYWSRHTTNPSEDYSYVAFQT